MGDTEDGQLDNSRGLKLWHVESRLVQLQMVVPFMMEGRSSTLGKNMALGAKHQSFKSMVKQSRKTAATSVSKLTLYGAPSLSATSTQLTTWVQMQPQRVIQHTDLAMLQQILPGQLLNESAGLDVQNGNKLVN